MLLQLGMWGLAGTPSHPLLVSVQVAPAEGGMLMPQHKRASLGVALGSSNASCNKLSVIRIELEIEIDLFLSSRTRELALSFMMIIYDRCWIECIQAVGPRHSNLQCIAL
jgi:hypothetical protein